MLDKVVCTYPKCCREIALAQFKKHFVASHLRAGEDYSEETRFLYSHDASNCRLPADYFARRSGKKQPKSKRRPANAATGDVCELEQSINELRKDVDKLAAAMASGTGACALAAGADTATVATDPEGSLTVTPSGKSPLLSTRDACGPISKTVPTRMDSASKRRLDFDGDDSDESEEEESLDTWTPSGKALPLDTLDLAGPSPRSIARPADTSKRSPKKRRVEALEGPKASASKAEVIMTIMTRDGIPDVTRTLRGSRKKANNTVRDAWREAMDAGVPCKLQVDELGYCLLLIPNASGTEDAIEARRIPQRNTLFDEALDE